MSFRSRWLSVNWAVLQAGFLNLCLLDNYEQPPLSKSNLEFTSMSSKISNVCCHHHKHHLTTTVAWIVNTFILHKKAHSHLHFMLKNLGVGRNVSAMSLSASSSKFHLMAELCNHLRIKLSFKMEGYVPKWVNNLPPDQFLNRKVESGLLRNLYCQFDKWLKVQLSCRWLPYW